MMRNVVHHHTVTPVPELAAFVRIGRESQGEGLDDGTLWHEQRVM